MLRSYFLKITKSVNEGNSRNHSLWISQGRPSLIEAESLPTEMRCRAETGYFERASAVSCYKQK